MMESQTRQHNSQWGEELETECQHQGHRLGQRRDGLPTAGKRRLSPVRSGLRDRPERKPIIIRNLYAVLNNTEILENKNDHTMIRIRLHGTKDSTTVNAMIDSGATEDFIDQEFCNKYQIKTIKAKNSREIYLAHAEPSSMGPVTHIARIPMDIGAHREITTFQVVKLQHHDAILGMPWLKNHNPRIDWGQGMITFDSERCTTMCLKESPTVYAIPETEAWEENLVSRFSTIQANKDKCMLVKKTHKDGKIPTKGTRGAAGHDLNAIEDKTIPAK